MSVDLTHVVRNAIARLISSLALLVTYKAFATMVWKAAAASLDSFLQAFIHYKKIDWCCTHFGMALPKNLVSIVVILDG
jgi:hypothetical protein